VIFRVRVVRDRVQPERLVPASHQTRSGAGAAPGSCVTDNPDPPDLVTAPIVRPIRPA